MDIRSRILRFLDSVRPCKVVAQAVNANTSAAHELRDAARALNDALAHKQCVPRRRASDSAEDESWKRRQR